MNRQTYTIELPAAVGRRVARAAKRERRKPADLAVEALQRYLSTGNLEVEKPTPAELRSIRQGEADFKRGNYIKLDEYLQTRSVGSSSHRKRKKVS